LALRARFLKVIQVLIQKSIFMADKLPFEEGASINSPPLFCGVNYHFWKVRMKIFVESIDKGFWDAIKNCPFVLMLENDKVIYEKPWS